MDESIRGRLRPRELRVRLYEEVLRLREQELSYREIQKRVFEEEGELLDKSTISYWVRRIHTPYGDGLGRPSEDQRTRRLSPCPELAYVIGSGLGDGSVIIEKISYRYRVVLAVKDYDFAIEFGRCAALALGKPKPYRPFWDGRRWVVAVSSKELYELLKKPVDIERIRPYVEYSRECMAAFIRGFADAEGCVSKHPRTFCDILITNTDHQLVLYVQRLLEKLGIYSKIFSVRMNEFFVINGEIRRRRKTVYRLVIRRRCEKVRFKELVNFTIARKRQILELLKP
ncbi:MAG: hypothetical protein NZ929_01455 [Aigarchaeota archaeon]|nr:hypothetical protein [Aigarchaeota archaeon]MDW7986500.1 LAGLIDADG family homing endonuclease [Nitrososphaerota archaeon]